jgi:hypothetical protein
MKTNQPEENFSEDPMENLHIENQILKLKMQAESGAFFGEMDKDLPPEIEHDFLKHVQEFEEAWQNVKQVPVFELLGKPDFIKADLLDDEKIVEELDRLIEIMEEREIQLDILGEYPARLIYTFITEELFQLETDDLQLPGWTKNFIYEEFHPNHPLDIKNRVKEFMDSWIEKSFNEYSWELDKTFILPDGTTVSKEDFIDKANLVFLSYNKFTDCEFEISEVSFQWNAEEEKGIGHAEGKLSYLAELENGEAIKYEGPFKFYLSNEFGMWKIYYFIFPGFTWS